MTKFALKSEYSPAGDQPAAIEKLVEGYNKGYQHQVLLGVTGSGKTFTAANVIQQVQKPTLVIAHNKTLAAQLALEYQEFFPENAVHYFVSYYDYYQPEAYMPTSDTYIEKEAQINAEIERLRHATTQALLTRSDVIVVASVSAIYGLGSPEEYKKVHLQVSVGQSTNRSEFIRNLVRIYFDRTNADLQPGQFRLIGNKLELMPTSENFIYRIEFGPSGISQIDKLDSITREILVTLNDFFIFPARHFVTPEDERLRAIEDIKDELDKQLALFETAGKVLEYERLKRRTRHDLSMIREMGYCNGIENYSRHFDGRDSGEPAHTLLSYFPKKVSGEPDFLTVIDESHVTIPQIGGMYAGDQSRKRTLVEHGFRLPSAADNRPLMFEEFEQRVGQTIYTSATPGQYEIEKSEQTVQQIIRPTGLVDPVLEVKPVVQTESYPGQVKHFIEQAVQTVKNGHRTIATTLTKKMAEDLSEFLKEKKVKAEYLHSDIKTIERIEIITSFRKGEFDCLVGVNLLREGLDLPEVAFIGILDADKEGFLRSETALIQIIGRAARNVEGSVTLYADNITRSMKKAMDETERRRTIQLAYNKDHGITPKSISKSIKDITEQISTGHKETVNKLLRIDKEELKKDPAKLIAKKKKQMEDAVKVLDFETAAIVRDEIVELEKLAQS